MQVATIKKRDTLYLVIVVLILGDIGAAWASYNKQNLSQRWNPRKVPADAKFVGDESCAQCHKKQTIPHAQSPMGLAMQSVASTSLLIDNQLLTYREGPYSYSIKRKDQQSIYTVTNGKETISMPILYAVGQGRAGQTYLLEDQGVFYESRVSFYQKVGGLDLTIGAPTDVPSSLKLAVGRVLSETEVANCFGCHSTGGMNGGKLTLQKVDPGVGCEACHGPSGPHVTAIQSGTPGGKLVFNPANLGGDQLSQDFCGSCHLVGSNFEELRKLEVNNVRFQPYRIFYSKCYSDDRRISCATCHDAHEALNQDPQHYDAKCIACHSEGGSKAESPQGVAALCKVGTKDCASCHMPKVELPGAHFEFTDHYIRVVKPGAPYPN